MRVAEETYATTLSKLASSFPADAIDAVLAPAPPPTTTIPATVKAPNTTLADEESAAALAQEGNTMRLALNAFRDEIANQAVDHLRLAHRAKYLEKQCQLLTPSLDEPSKKFQQECDKANKTFSKLQKQKDAAAKKLASLKTNFDRKKQFKRKWIQGGVPQYRIVELKGQKEDVQAAELSEYKARQARDNVTIAALRKYQGLEFQRISSIRNVLATVVDLWQEAAITRQSTATHCRQRIDAVSAIKDSNQFLQKVRGPKPCPWPGIQEHDTKLSLVVGEGKAEVISSPSSSRLSSSKSPWLSASSRAKAAGVFAGASADAAGEADSSLLTAVLGDTMADPTEASRAAESKEKKERDAAEALLAANSGDGDAARILAEKEVPRASIHATESMMQQMASVDTATGSASSAAAAAAAKKSQDPAAVLTSPKKGKAISHSKLRKRVAEKRQNTLKFKKKRQTLTLKDKVPNSVGGDGHGARAVVSVSGGGDFSSSGQQLERGRGISRSARVTRLVDFMGLPKSRKVSVVHGVHGFVASRSGNRATDLLPAEERTVHFVPWFPGDGHAWNPPMWLWKRASLETLLLHTDMFGGTLPQQMMENVIRVQMGVGKTEYMTLLRALHFPSLSCPKEMYHTVNYRVHLLSTVPSSDFDEAGESVGSGSAGYISWFDRQAAVILASLLWHVLNDPQNVWKVASKTSNSEKLSKRLEKLIFALRAKVREEMNVHDGVSVTRADRFRARTVMHKANSSAAYVGKSSKELLVIINRLMAEVAACSKSDRAKGVPGDFLAFPEQVVRNMYGHMVWTCFYKMEEDEDDIAEKKHRQAERKASKKGGDAKGAFDDDEEEPEVAHLHDQWEGIVKEISVYRNASGISDTFHHLCLLRICSDVIASQAATFDCNGLDTCIVDEDKGLLDIFNATLAALEKCGRAASTNNLFWSQTLRTVLQRLETWLQDYHQSDPDTLRRCAGIYVRLLDLKAGVRGSITSKDMVRVQEVRESIGRLMRKSVDVEYQRIRDLFPKFMSGEEWLNWAKEVVVFCDTDANIYSKAWGDCHDAPHEVSIIRIAACLCSELRDLFEHHEALDNLTLRVLPIMMRVVERIQKHVGLFSDPDVLLTSLPVMETVYESQLHHWVKKHCAKTIQWLDRSVSIDDWVAIGANTPYSSSVVDVFSIIFSLVELFFKHLAAVQGAVDCTSTIPNLTGNLKSVVAHYASIIMRSCDARGLDEVRPGFVNRTKVVMRWRDDGGKKSAGGVLGSGSRHASRAESKGRGKSGSVKPTAAENRVAKQMSAAGVTAAGARAAAGIRTEFATQSISSLCVRYCNVTLAEEKLKDLEKMFFVEWKKFAAKLSKDVVDMVETENGWKQPNFALFGSLSRDLEGYKHTLCSLIAGRVVYVEWGEPLLASLYSPLPSACSVQTGELQGAIDNTMADLFHRVLESAFNGVVMQVFSFLMDAVEWILLVREHPVLTGRDADCGQPPHEILLSQMEQRFNEKERAIVRADIDVICDMFGVELEKDVSRALSKKVRTLVDGSGN